MNPSSRSRKKEILFEHRVKKVHKLKISENEKTFLLSFLFIQNTQILFIMLNSMQV